MASTFCASFRKVQPPPMTMPSSTAACSGNTHFQQALSYLNLHSKGTMQRYSLQLTSSPCSRCLEALWLILMMYDHVELSQH